MKTFLIAALCFLAIALHGCSSSSPADSYTEQTARAIIEAGSKIALAILISACIKAIFNK